MIFTERKITVRKGKSSIDEPVILYRGDFEVELRFTIMETKYRFKSGVNLVDSEKASHAQLALLAPDGANVFTEIGRCEDGTAIFVLSKEMIDELSEVGLYSFQIRLFDYYRESRVSIPPVEFGIEVREPIAAEDHVNTVDEAMVGYSIAKTSVLDEPVPETFDDNGQYNKTDWETGDRISEGKLNKIEDAVHQINQNEKNDVAALDKRITNNFNTLNATKADASDVNSKIANFNDKVWSMANMGQDVKTAMTGGSVAVVGNNTVLTENIVNGQVTAAKTNFMTSTVINRFNTPIHHAERWDTAGNIIKDGTFARTAFIKVDPLATYTVPECSWSGYFDINYNFISNIGEANKTFTTPANCAYVSFSLKNPSEFQMTAYRLSEEYVAFKAGAIKPHHTTFFDEIDIASSIKFTTNHYIQPDGSLLASPNYILTDYIEVDPLTFYSCSETSSSGYYDENKNFISLIGKFASSGFVTPHNCHYIRLALMEAGKFYFNKYALKPEFINISSDIVIGPENISFIEGDFVTSYKPSDVTAGYRLDSFTGEIVADANFSLTPFYKVEPNSVYTVRECSYSCYYNSNKEYIGYIGEANKTFTTPKNCVYVRFSLKQPSMFKFDIGNYILSEDIKVKGDSLVDLDIGIDDLGIVNKIVLSTYKKEDLTPGYRLNSDTGAIDPDPIFSLSPLYAVLPNTTYTIPEAQYCGYYDEAQTFIGKIGYQNTTFTTPVNCAYVRFSIQYPDAFSFEASAYELQKGIQLDYDALNNVKVKANQTEFFHVDNNAGYKPGDAVQGYRLDHLTGAVVVDPAMYLTPYYRVSPNTTYTVPECRWSGYFDINYNFISNIGEANKTFTTPANCAYVRFSLDYPGSFVFNPSAWVLDDNVRVKATSIMDLDIQDKYGHLIYDDLETYNDSQFDELLQIQKGNFTFAFSTDIHYQGNSQANSHPDGLKHIMNTCKISDLADLQFVAFGGDVLQGTNRNAMIYDLKTVADVCKNNMKVPYFFTIGNHDEASEYDEVSGGNTGSHIIKNNELHGLWIKPSLRYDIHLDVSNPMGNYFYKDFDNYNMRVIMLNAMDRDIIIENGKPKYKYSQTYCYSQKQLTWLVEKALNFEDKENGDEWGVVLFTHVPFIGNDYGTMHNGDGIVQILKAFKNGGSVNYSHDHADFGASINTTFTKGQRDVLVVEGHNHKNVYDKQDGIHYIQVLCSKGAGRTNNSVMNDAFGIFVIDREERTVTIKAYGSTSDRTYSLD